ncbi:elongation factor protein [Rhizobium etli CNPAF512]|nr:elongation factor protein [Rhizobium etli CNPAF512]
MPGETCSTAVSTSMKSSRAKKPRNAAWIALRPIRNGRRSACTDGVHQGDALAEEFIPSFLRRRSRYGGGYFPDFRLVAPPKKNICVFRAFRQSSTTPKAELQGSLMVKVIASSVRKGNVLDVDGKLYVVLTAQNFHPGKGTPVTQVDMRRIVDGVKVSERWRTTEQVERAFVEDVNFQYLYEDGEGFHFMNPANYDQVVVSQETMGDQKAYLQEGMTCILSIHEGIPLALELPRHVTLEIVETEPVVKGQTASSSYKPAMLSNGIRTSVPPHIDAGTRVVIATEDNSYVERAKD